MMYVPSPPKTGGGTQRWSNDTMRELIGRWLWWFVHASVFGVPEDIRDPNWWLFLANPASELGEVSLVERHVALIFISDRILGCDECDATGDF